MLWLVHLLTFAMLRMVPGDPAVAIAGEQAGAAEIARIRTALGLDVDPVSQYFQSVGDLLRGDLGDSLFTNRTVTSLVADAVEPTLSLALVALLMALVGGVGVGIVAGLNRGGWIDRVVSMAATIGIAIPSFWMGMLLILVFFSLLDWLPAATYVPISDGIGPWLRHVILPASALALAVGAELARHTRGAVAEVLERPYIRAARARGAAGSWMVHKHVLRNSAIPVVTVLGLQVGKLVGGTIVVESVFGISGLGTLAVDSVMNRDYEVIQGYVLIAATVVILVNLAVDALYGRINPKVRT